MGRKRGQTEFQQSLSSRALLSRYNNYCCHSFLDPLLVSETNILVRISASWRVTKIFHIRTCYFCQAEWLLIFLGILLPNIIRDFRSCTLYLHPLLIRVVTEGSHPFFFSNLVLFFCRWRWTYYHFSSSSILEYFTLMSNWKSRNAEILCGLLNALHRKISPKLTTTFPYSKLMTGVETSLIEFK